jgi:glutamate carboxypeptidase
MPSPRARLLLEYLTLQQEPMLQLLETLAAVESPSTVPASHAAGLELLQGELSLLSFDVHHIRGRLTGGHLLATPRSRQRHRPLQLMIGHSDTVWPAGTIEKMPIRRREGRLYGPGVIDMKGGLVMMLFALRALQQVEPEPSVTPVVFINTDEEIGSPESERQIVRLAKRMDRVWVLEPAMGRRGRIKTARKGIAEFTIHVRGRSAHAGLEPGKGVSAIVELSHVVQQLVALNRSIPGVTVNVGTIGGGLRTNIVAAEAFLTVDVRFRTENEGRRIEAAIRALEPRARGARLEVVGKICKPPLERTARNRLLWEMAKQVGRELDLDLQEAQVGGASDGNTTSLYAPTLDGLGPIGGGAHAAHEFVAIDSLVERTALLALLLATPAIAPAD